MHTNYVYYCFIFYIIIYAIKNSDDLCASNVMMLFCERCCHRVAIRQRHSFHCAHFKTWTSTTTSVSCPSSMLEDSKFSLIFLNQKVLRAWYEYDIKNFVWAVCSSASVLSNRVPFCFCSYTREFFISKTCLFSWCSKLSAIFTV